MTSRHGVMLVIALWLRQASLQDAADSQLLEDKAIVGSDHRTKVLYVLECEGVPEWQAIPAGAEAVNWVRNLKDRLTICQEHPDGEDVTVSPETASSSRQSRFCPVPQAAKLVQPCDTACCVAIIQLLQHQVSLTALQND